jgi:acetyl-CoA synthetase
VGARRSWLSGLPGGAGLNIGYEAVDRHVAGGRGDAVALRFRDRRDRVTDLTYADLARRTNQFANLLDALGIGRGERVFSLLGRIPELYLAGLGTLKHGSVYSPLFAAFGPEPVRERLVLGDGALLVTTPELYRTRVAPIRDHLPALRHVLVTGDAPPPPGTASLTAALLARTTGTPCRPPTRRRWRCCTSPAAPPASRRARCTSTRRWWPTTPPPGSRWTCAAATCSGAPPTRGG